MWRTVGKKHENGGSKSSLCLHASRTRGVANYEMSIPTLRGDHYFVASRPAWRSNSSFFQHLSGASAAFENWLNCRGGVAKVKILSATLHGNQSFFCFSPSVALEILIFAKPLGRQCRFSELPLLYWFYNKLRFSRASNVQKSR